MRSGSKRELIGIARSKLLWRIETLGEGITGTGPEAIVREENEGTGTEEIEETEEAEIDEVAAEEEETDKVETEETTTVKAKRRRSTWIRPQAKHHQTNKMSSNNSSNKNKVKPSSNAGHYTKTEAERVGLELGNFRNKPKVDNPPEQKVE